MNLSSWNDAISRLLKDPIHFFQQILSNLTTTTVIGYAFFFVLIAWGVALTKKYFALQRSRSPSPNTITEAIQAERSQDSHRAGELYEQAGQYDQAIRVYKEARDFEQAGRIYELQRHWEEAAQFYGLSGQIEKSAIMYQKGGAYLRAAEAYLACKKGLLAAQMYEKGKRYREAARLYEKFGDIAKSALLYEQANDFGTAAEKYEVHFLKQKVTTSSGTPDKEKQILQTGYKSGQLYLKVRRFSKAMEVFSAAGFPNQAADAALMAGAKEKAAQFYLEAGGYEMAAKLYEQLGDQKRGHWIMAKKYQEESNLLSAAKAFESGENWIEAGDMYEQVGEREAAARMYMNGGDCHRSAELFLMIEDQESAAKSLEKGGELKEAAALYTKLEMFDRAIHLHELLGDYYAAALLLKEQGKIDQSISSLQRVDPQSRDYYTASLLLGKMLSERGMAPAAIERLQKIVLYEQITPHTTEIFYQLAVLYEENKKFEEAVSLYGKILAEDLNYKDVKQRNELLKKALREVKRAIKPSQSEKVARRQSPTSFSESAARYKIIKKIGQGGMGIVYEAEDTILKRIVAYKVLPPAIQENHAILQNFLKEAQIAAALNHPNIVTLYDTGKNGNEIYITMEYVDGTSLKIYLKDNTPPIEESVEIMKSICQGVTYAHSQNVVHRDLKPANIMLLRNRKVKIMDFGLAKVLTESMADKTSVKGTPLYMSPEQILGEKVDQQSDIYSLGCTFYRMVTGRPLFTKGDIYYHHLHTLPTSPKTLNPDLPSWLEQIVLKCIEKKKENRYIKIRQLLNELELNT